MKKEITNKLKRLVKKSFSIVTRKLEFDINLVARMGFEPMNIALRGQRVKPLHQRVNTYLF